MTPEQVETSALLKLRNRRHCAEGKLIHKLERLQAEVSVLNDQHSEQILAKLRRAIRLDELRPINDWQAEAARFLSGRDVIILAELWDWDGDKGLTRIRAADVERCLEDVHEIYWGCFILVDEADGELFVSDFEHSDTTPNGVSTQRSMICELPND